MLPVDYNIPAQSPSSRLAVPVFKLAAPVTSDRRTIDFHGFVIAQLGATTQQVVVRLYDDDVVDDDLLSEVQLSVVRPSGAWAGMLIPYTGHAVLNIDENGHVVGDAGSSGEDVAEVYQYLVGDDLASDILEVF
jgi:hypothetical protein